MKQWPAHNPHFWETAPFFRVLLPVVAGIVCYSYLPAHFPVPLTLLLAVVAFVLFTITVFIRPGSFVNTLCFVFFNAAMLFGMLTLCQLNDVRQAPNPIGSDTTGYMQVRVTDQPLVRERTSRATVQALCTIKGSDVAPASGSAYIYAYNTDDITLQQGDTLLIPNHWQRITNRGDPFEYDYAAYCARNGICYRQFIDEDDIAISGHGTGKQGLTARCHDWCAQQLATYIPDEETRVLVQAMLLGDETNLDDNLKHAWAETGIMHFIAISGGNITMFFVIITYLLWWLRHQKHLWVKYLVALPLIWLYVVVAGASPSAVRAAVMFSIVAASFALQKNANSLNTLFAAAALLLVAEPMWLYSAGFQLSFVAILSLILFYGPISALWSPRSKITGVLWRTIASSLAVEILVAPLIILYFYLFPLPFLVSNLLAFLFMNVVLILGMAIIALSFIPFVAKAIGWLVVVATSSFDDIIFALQRFNPASFSYLYLTGWELVCVYITITGLALFWLRDYKKGSFLALGCGCVLMLLLCRDEYTALEQERFVAYNMGAVNHMEVITGKHHQVVRTDIHTLTTEKDRTLKPAHAAWSAWQALEPLTGQDISWVNGRSVLVLEKPISTGSFPVDYLIADMPPGLVHPGALYRVFHPRMLVFSGNYTAAQSAKLLKECKALHIPAWAVGIDGAFIWSN